MTIAYTKIHDIDKNPYIMTINTDEYHCLNKIFNSEHAIYKIVTFTIIKIENIYGIDIDKIGSFEIDKTYSEIIFGWLKRDIAFNHKFIENKEYLLFIEGYRIIHRIL